MLRRASGKALTSRKLSEISRKYVNQNIFDSLKIGFSSSTQFREILCCFKALKSGYFLNMLGCCSRRDYAFMDTAVPITRLCNKRDFKNAFQVDVQQFNAKRRKIAHQKESDFTRHYQSVQEIRKKKRARQKQRSQLNPFFYQFRFAFSTNDGRNRYFQRSGKITINEPHHRSHHSSTPKWFNYPIAIWNSTTWRSLNHDK